MQQTKQWTQTITFDIVNQVLPNFIEQSWCPSIEKNPDFQGLLSFSELKIEYLLPQECHVDHECCSRKMSGKIGKLKPRFSTNGLKLEG